MKHLKRTFLLGLLFTCFLLNPALYAHTYTGGHTDTPTSVEITSPKTTIDIGEPLILKLTYKFEEPQIFSSSGEVRPAIRKENLLLKVEGKTDEAGKLIYVPYVDLFLDDTKGLIYKGEVFIWYNAKELNLAFDSEGSYLARLLATEKLESNALSIDVVAPLAKEEKVISMLSNPDDFVFLLHGICEKGEKAKRLAALEKIVDQSEGATLAKWCAARLGLEAFGEFYKKHPSFEKFKVLKKQSQTQWPLYDKARLYLSKGVTLPDEFPIREEVLSKLVNMEFTDENYEKAFLLLDELRTKYPDGKYGRKASGWKEELIELQKRELAQAPQPRMGGWSRLLPLFLVIAAGIVLIGLILVLKKKASSRGKSRAT